MSGHLSEASWTISGAPIVIGSYRHGDSSVHTARAPSTAMLGTPLDTTELLHPRVLLHSHLGQPAFVLSSPPRSGHVPRRHWDKQS